MKIFAKSKAVIQLARIILVICFLLSFSLSCAKPNPTSKIIYINISLPEGAAFDTIEVLLNSNSKQYVVIYETWANAIKLPVRITENQFPAEFINAQLFMKECHLKSINLYYRTSHSLSNNYTATPTIASGTCHFNETDVR
jgi:hypothetical protein